MTHHIGALGAIFFQVIFKYLNYFIRYNSLLVISVSSIEAIVHQLIIFICIKQMYKLLVMLIYHSTQLLKFWIEIGSFSILSFSSDR